MRVTDVTAESGLTRDTVPVDVDAIVFWTAWDAQRSVLEVADYFGAVSLSAQTALREAIGRNMLAEMITERERLGHELQKIIFQVAGSRTRGAERLPSRVSPASCRQDADSTSPSPRSPARSSGSGRRAAPAGSPSTLPRACPIRAACRRGARGPG